MVFPPVFFFCFFLHIFFLFRCLCGGFICAREYIDSHGGLGVLRGCFFFGVCGGFPRLQSGLSMVSPPIGVSDESRAIPPPLFFVPCHSFFLCVWGSWKLSCRSSCRCVDGGSVHAYM